MNPDRGWWKSQRQRRCFKTSGEPQKERFLTLDPASQHQGQADADQPRNSGNVKGWARRRARIRRERNQLARRWLSALLAAFALELVALGGATLGVTDRSTQTTLGRNLVGDALRVLERPVLYVPR